MRNMSSKIWIEVTQDEYELPVAVADTARELAEIVGTTTNNIISQCSHRRKGRLKSSRFRMIEIEEEESERTEGTL